MSVPSTSFSGGKDICKLQDRDINDASGLAASRVHPDILYTHNDKGRGKTNIIYAVNSKTGNTVAELTISGVTNYGWEDVAVGKSGGNFCIYIAETGGVARGGAKNIIYRVREPLNLKNQDLHVEKKLEFTWAEKDCKTVMVAPNEDIYVVSRVHSGRGTLAKLSSKGWDDQNIMKVESSVELKQPYENKYDPVLGGDISLDGKEMLIKFKKHVYYWYVPDGNYIKAVSNAPADLPYQYQREGESVCWDSRGLGYFTTRQGKYQPLYYYSRSVGHS